MAYTISLAGKVAVVTGGSTGIGRASVVALAEAGADVIFTYLASPAAAAETVEQTRPFGSKVKAVRCDVTKREDVEALKAQVLDEFGKVDILVNNAGAAIRRAPFLEGEEELWEQSFQLNVMGVVRCCQAFLPVMLQQKRGRIINISSLAAATGGIGNSVHYASMKGAVNTLTIGLANEFSPHGITVNAIAPGLIDTPFQVKTPGHDFEKARRSTPVRRIGVPEDIAPMVVYLASDQASFITGEIYHIDGGR
ncbi:MAG: hypothetical protein BAA01_08965 [Bacillus thermozeamaize]|uniref:Oxidoreductase n=1 Tax=Bacillus thermozeamaize TaxID=230954 RepID=A0A1Y3PIM1_9BACI|nr:MAG: hypothetical protein BAA01_08965 [Bacillus thermozeamaize]